MQACAALRISHRRARISSRSARGSGEAAAGAGARAAAAGERSAWHGAARAAARAALRSGRRTHRRRRHGLHGVGTEGRRLWRSAQAAVAVANLSLPDSAHAESGKGKVAAFSWRPRVQSQICHHSPTPPNAVLARERGSQQRRLGAEAPCAAVPPGAACAHAAARCSAVSAAARAAPAPRRLRMPDQRAQRAAAQRGARDEPLCTLRSSACP